MRPLRAFISYSHKDEKYRLDLETQLALLKRQGLLQCWSDRVIRAGQPWEEEIDANLENADLILLLISPDFLASDYCYEKELKRALTRHDRGSSILVPIVVRHCAWQNSPIAKFQVLPYNAKPVSAWGDQDAAWVNVVEGIGSICREFWGQASRSAKDAFFAGPESGSLVVGIFGLTGVGKSTLCNAMLGREVMRVSDLASCTREVQRGALRLGKVDMNLNDYPGLGEDEDLDRAWLVRYRNSISLIDIVVWVMRADVRATKDDRYFIHHVLQDFAFTGRLLVALNMVDRVEPVRDWNVKGRRPGRNQLVNIDRRREHLEDVLKIPHSAIVPVSASEGYNVDLVKKFLAMAAEGKRLGTRPPT